MEKLKRSSGILLHITSLPAKFGWGTFSSFAFDFVDFLKDGGFGVWQVLPFSDCTLGNSPYSAISSFAINPYFLDISQFLSESEICDLNLNVSISLDDFHLKTNKALDLICKKYKGHFDLNEFIKKNNYWLEDYATFKVAKKVFKNTPWNKWPDAIKNRKKSELNAFKLEHKEEIDDIILIQYLLEVQWKKIKQYANENQIEIFGDIPFYVEFDSCDVWVNPKDWCLENGKPKLVAGVPPDYFNSEGQLWGNPIYNYQEMSKNKFAYLTKRIKRQCDLYDILRIDHFVAFSRYWSIPVSSKSAKNGKWEKGVGEDLLKEILSKCKIKIVAEDLGIVTDEVIKLKNKFDIAGIKVIGFAFDNDCDNVYKPYNFEKNCVAYIGTHDNPTFMQILNSGDWDKINRIKKYLHMPLEQGNDCVIENMIIDLYKSSANLIILTAQDILHLDGEARMNIPGIAYGNWEWKLNEKLDKNLCYKFKDYAITYGRTK